MKKPLILLAVAMFLMNVAFFVSKQSKPAPPKPERPAPVTPIPETPSPPEEEEPEPEPEIVPEFVEVPVFKQHSEQSVYGDVLSHSKDAAFGDSSGRATNAHETGHGIHSYLRNKYTQESGKKVNGFYALEGRGIIIEEPKMRKSQINKFVPENLRSYRYSTYLAGQQAWDDTPLYIYDEWVAYILGGKCNVDDVKNGRYKGGWTDGVSGCLDFSIYAMALAMAVKEIDPTYWEDNKQFRAATIWLLREAHKTYMLGHTMEEFKWDKQDALLKEFLTSSSAEPMREFVRDHLEGVWLDTKVADLNLHYGPQRSANKDVCHAGCLRKKVGE